MTKWSRSTCFWGDGVYKPTHGSLHEDSVEPLKQEVKDQGLWACHLSPQLGGRGFGQVKLALMNELLGRSPWAPIIFGCQAPDSGNAEIISVYGTEEQKAKYLRPLLDGEIFSCYSMTEPQGGADPEGVHDQGDKRRGRVGPGRLEVLLVACGIS